MREHFGILPTAPPPSTAMVAAPHPAVMEAQQIFGTGQTADEMSAEIQGQAGFMQSLPQRNALVGEEELML